MNTRRAAAGIVWTAMSVWAIWSIATQPSGIPAWAVVLIVVVIAAAWLVIIARREAAGPAALLAMLLAALALGAAAVFGPFVPERLPIWTLPVLLVPLVGLWLILVRNTGRAGSALALLAWLALPLVLWGAVITVNLVASAPPTSGG